MKRKFVMLYAMLGISLLLFAVGAFAWFNVSANPTTEGTQLQAITDQSLKIYANSPGFTTDPSAFANYVNSINFASTAPFVDTAVTGAKFTNISGNGLTFYRLSSTPAYVSGVTGIHNYLELEFWFTSFSGDTGDSSTSWVYLTSTASIDKYVPEGGVDLDITPSIRVAFLNAAKDNIIGIWAPGATTISEPAHTGDIYYVKADDAYSAATGIVGRYIKTEDPAITTYDITPSAAFFDVERIVHGDLYEGLIQATPLLQITNNVDHSLNQKMVVRIWIEGADAATQNSNIRALSRIKLAFGAAPIASFAPQPTAAA